MEKEMMFVVYRLSPYRVYSIHRSFAGAAQKKNELVSAGEDTRNIETYGLYVEE